MRTVAVGVAEHAPRRGVVQEDGVAVDQLELDVAERRRRPGALDHAAVRGDVHVVGAQIAGAAWQDFVAGDAGRDIPGRIGHDRGERPFQAGRLVGRRADHDAVRVNRATLVPVDHDGRSRVDLDPLGVQLALEPAAAFQVQGDLACAILGRGRQGGLRALADDAVRDQAVTDLEAAHGRLDVFVVEGGRRVDGGHVGAAEIAFGVQAADQVGDARVAVARTDRAAAAEARPAAVQGDVAIADIAGRQVGVADVGRSQGVQEVGQAVLDQGLGQGRAEQNPVLLHRPQLLDRGRIDRAFRQDAGVAQGRGRQAHVRELRVRDGGHAVQVVGGIQTVAVRLADRAAQRRHPLGRPGRPPAHRLVEGADLGLQLRRLGRQLVVEGLVEGAVPADGRRRRLAEREAARERHARGRESQLTPIDAHGCRFLHPPRPDGLTGPT